MNSAFSEFKVYHMKELDEVRGPLYHVEESSDGIVALIGKIPTWLPSELGPRLRDLQGRKIACIRLDGYRLKEI